MEDERIAKTLLAALLKKEVVSVQMRCHEHTINRLTAATVTAEVRREMNVEDEFFSAIENRDTELMKQKRIIAEKDEQLRSMISLMLNNGMSISHIVQATGLTQQQIANLK